MKVATKGARMLDQWVARLGVFAPSFEGAYMFSLLLSVVLLDLLHDVVKTYIRYHLKYMDDI